MADSMRRAPRRRDLSGARKYVLVQSQLVFLATIIGLTYLLATRVNMAIAILFAIGMVGLQGWVWSTVKRHAQRSRPRSEEPS